MERQNSLRHWFFENRDMCVEMLRIYLGVVLCIKGIQFLMNQEQAQEYLAMVNLPFVGYFMVHIIGLVHLAGGLLLALGLLTRVAALIQVPILFGAVFFVHIQQGLFTKEQNLEFVILVLFLLLFFVIYGGGRFSVDGVLEKRASHRL